MSFTIPTSTNGPASYATSSAPLLRVRWTQPSRTSPTHARSSSEGAAFPRTNDLAELFAIHNHLFQDVYDWAGQPRTVDIRKKSDGAAFFAPVRMIERSAGYAAESLREDGFLRALPRERLIERLALHYDQFNYLHPFREGNGRTQRIFWSRVVRDAGYDLDWRDIPGEVNDAACHTAAAGDLSGLVAMFDALVTKLP